MSSPPPLRQPGDTGLLRRVRRRLMAWSAGSTFVLLIALGAALYGSVSASLAASGTAQLEQRADGLVALLSGIPELPPPDVSPDTPFGRPVFGGPASGTLAIIVDQDGTLIGPRPPDAEGLPISDGVDGAFEDGQDLRTTTLNSTPVRVLSETFEVQGATYVIQVIQDRSAEQRTLEALLVVLLVGGMAALALAAGFGYLYAGRALVPIRESLRRQREFAADASHELRTPLTVLRASVEDLRRHRDQPVREVGDVLEDMEVEVDHLSTLVDDLLLLARSDSGVVELRRDLVDLPEVAGESLQRLRAQAKARGVELRLDAAPATVAGDRDRLRQMVGILVDNAIRHAPQGSVVKVQIHGPDHPGLTVEDSGPGIRPEDLPRLFDRFWQAPDAPDGGTGLGLAIAAWIADHHGGSIVASNRSNGGARFEVQLPPA